VDADASALALSLLFCCCCSRNLLANLLLPAPPTLFNAGVADTAGSCFAGAALLLAAALFLATLLTLLSLKLFTAGVDDEALLFFAALPSTMAGLGGSSFLAGETDAATGLAGSSFLAAACGGDEFDVLERGDFGGIGGGGPLLSLLLLLLITGCSFGTNAGFCVTSGVEGFGGIDGVSAAGTGFESVISGGAIVGERAGALSLTRESRRGGANGLLLPLLPPLFGSFGGIFGGDGVASLGNDGAIGAGPFTFGGIIGGGACAAGVAASEGAPKLLFLTSSTNCSGLAFCKTVGLRGAAGFERAMCCCCSCCVSFGGEGFAPAFGLGSAFGGGVGNDLGCGVGNGLPLIGEIGV